MKKGGKIILIVVATLAIVGFIKEALSGEESTKPKYYSDLSAVVQTYADKMLVSQLKYPDGWKYEYKKTIREDSVTYIFQSVVLAKNGFGVRSRLTYFVKMQYVGSKEDSNGSVEVYSASDKWKILRNELTQ